MRSSSGRRGSTAAMSASLATIALCYVGFPAYVLARSVVRPRPLRPGGAPVGTVSIVIAAHNEAASIAATLDRIAAQQVDVDVEVVVASDGSTDDTVAIARRHPSRPTVLDLPRSGKAGALNAAIDRVDSDIVVFTDANTRLGDGAIAAVLEPFSDPTVGGVAGDQRYGTRVSGTATSERDYWSYERTIKRWQHRGGSVTSSTGALHAVRRVHLEPIPADVPDDFFISTGVRSDGARLAFAEDAVAWEEPNERPEAEYRRRVRIITSGLTGVWRRRDLLDIRRHGDEALVFFLHKVVRRLVPIPMVVLFVASARASAGSRIARLLLGGQLAFYGAALVGTAAPTSRLGRSPLVALPAHFCNANIAAAHAIVNVVRGRAYTRWTPERS